MSKIYERYLELKKQDDQKMYLFHCGNFYIFLQEDALKINEYVVLKITTFAKNVSKCGFPVNSFDKYMHVFKNHKLEIEVIEKPKEETAEKIIKEITNLDLENMTPMEALNKLYEFQKKCH